MVDAWTVPQSWRDETAVCIASGPSLTSEQVNTCRGRSRVIVVNDGYRLAPWADLLYFCDEKWWRWHREKPAFRAFSGTKASLSLRAAAADSKIKWLVDAGWNPDRGVSGIDPRPGHIINGRNSGYQALHLAVHLGAKRILLLGYDMSVAAGERSHWFGEHRNEDGHEVRTSPRTIAKWARHFETMVADLEALGVTVLNATPGSAIPCFPRVELADCLEPGTAAL